MLLHMVNGTWCRPKGVAAGAQRAKFGGGEWGGGGRMKAARKCQVDARTCSNT